MTDPDDAVGAITEAKVTAIVDQLDAAADDWPTVARSIPEVARVDLIDRWARDNAPDAVCHPYIVRDESGRWLPLGWSNASLMLLERPHGHYDEDAGVHTDD